MPNYFVWVKGLRGPEAQLWAEKQVDGGGKAKETLSVIELDQFEKRLSLDVLKARFPHA